MSKLSRLTLQAESSCSRTWEIEAIEDGRLVDASLESTDRHVATCPECARERASLAALRHASTTLPEPVISELERRRQRSQLLRQANEQLVARSTPNRLRWGMGLAAAAATMALAATLMIRGGRTPTGAQVSGPVFEISSVRDAAWRADPGGTDARPELSNGVAHVHVHPLKPGQRFVLKVPDGEIEVHGTRFVVAVEHGRTSNVEVTEGIVALRLGGQDERFLRAGERWSPTLPTMSRGEPIPAPSGVPDSPSSTTTAAPQPSAGSLPGTSISPSVRAATSAPRSTSRGGVEGGHFATAMRAFSSGAYAEADTQFASFVSKYPNDPRSEDAAFLRVVARQRMGDTTGAAARANAYLLAYPNGLRRKEALLIAGGR